MCRQKGSDNIRSRSKMKEGTVAHRHANEKSEPNLLSLDNPESVELTFLW
jgi:hypothetical protein